MKFALFIQTIVFVIEYRFVTCITNNEAELLRFELLKNYDSFTEPQPQNGTTLPIDAGPYVLGLHVDYMKSTFQVNGWLRMSWQDSRLKWDPAKFANMTILHFAPHEIWRPQIVTLNRVDAHNIENYAQVNAMVNYTGEVLTVPLTSYKVICNLNYYDWPFDKQVCELILRVSGTHSAPIKFNVTYMPSNEGVASDWMIEDVNSEYTTTNSCVTCSGPVSELRFEFHVKKSETKYYGFVILPAFGMCFLLLSTFWLPLTTMKKFTITITLAIMPLVFLIFLSRKVPVFNHQLPRIMLFYIWLMILSIIHLMTSLILHNVANSDTLHANPLAHNIVTLFDHTILHSLRIVPDSEFVRYQVEKMDAVQELDRNHTKHQWLHITIVINRIIFLFYSIISIILMLYYFI